MKIKMKDAVDNAKIKGVLTLLIAEIKDIIDSNQNIFEKMTKIDNLLDGWIKVNDLHPEKVKEISMKELQMMLGEK